MSHVSAAWAQPRRSRRTSNIRLDYRAQKFGGRILLENPTVSWRRERRPRSLLCDDRMVDDPEDVLTDRAVPVNRRASGGDLLVNVFEKHDKLCLPVQDKLRGAGLPPKALISR